MRSLYLSNLNSPKNDLYAIATVKCKDNLSEKPHTAPDPVPITIVSHKNTPALMNVIICFVCYINIVSRLLIELFYYNV